MRARLRELLRCPTCASGLECVPIVKSSDGQDVIEGVLICGCGASYPTVNTIPRMLRNAYALFPEFVARYGHRSEFGIAAAAQQGAASAPPQVILKTQQSFEYQWTTFSEMACDFRDNFWNYLKPATPEFRRGRVGLDAGCGFGRHLHYAADCGAEMIGMDLGLAIDASYGNTKQFPNVHLVQGDIYAPPFAPGTVVYHSLCGPLDLATGLIEGATPALAYRVALGYAQGPGRHAEEQMHADHRRPPSRSTLERLGKAIGTQTHCVAPRIEASLRREETVPEGTHAIVAGLESDDGPDGRAAPRRRRPGHAPQAAHDTVYPHPAADGRRELSHGLCGGRILAAGATLSSRRMDAHQLRGRCGDLHGPDDAQHGNAVQAQAAVPHSHTDPRVEHATGVRLSMVRPCFTARPDVRRGRDEFRLTTSGSVSR